MKTEVATSSDKATAVKLPGPVARQVFRRSLILQASWNDQRMQNLGLLATLAPLLRHLDLDRNQLRQTCRRYYGFFNTNPYLASYVIGGLLRLENDMASGTAVPERMVTGFRDTLARACGSLGDQLFWLGLRPAVMLTACGMAVFWNWQAGLVPVVLFALGQLLFRRRGLNLGYSLGPDVVDVISRPLWHRAIAWARRVALALTGILAGLYFAGLLDQVPTLGLGPVIGCLVVGLGLPALVRQKASGESQLLLSLIFALGLALLF